jgi:hypothetical protein
MREGTTGNVTGVIWLLAAVAFPPAPRTADPDGRILLCEAFDTCSRERLPDGWSSSRGRFLLWPDIVLTSTGSSSGDRAALASSVSGEAWLRSPVLEAGGLAGVDVRCRVSVSDPSRGCVSVELLPEGGPPASSERLRGLRPGRADVARVSFALTGGSGTRVAVRWRMWCDPEARPVSVSIDDVSILGVDEGAWRARDDAGAVGSVGDGVGVVVNEIMYAPAGGEPEWVELLNAGEEDAALTGWAVSDASGARSGPLPAVVLPPGSRLIVTRDLPAFARARGDPACGAAAPGSMPALNNGGDAVILTTAAGDVADSVVYAPAWGGSGGRSLERLDPRAPPDRRNWLECADSTGATPCAVNSVALLPVDLAIVLKPVYRFAFGSPPVPEAVLRNDGTRPIPEAQVRWFVDEDRNGVADTVEEFARRRITEALAPGDSVTVSVPWDAARPGYHRLLAQGETAGDGRARNDLAGAEIIVGHPPCAVVLNEIMYQPLAGEPEYVEITASGKPVDLAGWRLEVGWKEDGTPGRSVALAPAGALGGGGGSEAGFVVVSSDSALLLRFGSLPDSSGAARLLVTGTTLGLDNSGDIVRVVDPAGGTVDSVPYSPDWHSPSFTDVTGRSLERIHPLLVGPERQSWSTSVDPAGGTPGRPNSVMVRQTVPGSSLRVSPNPFSPDGDGHEDHAVVSYRLAAAASYTIIRVFDRTGRLIRTLAERERGGIEGAAAWDGRDDLARRVRMGLYILHLEARDESGVTIASARTVVAVAGRL